MAENEHKSIVSCQELVQVLILIRGKLGHLNKCKVKQE